MKQSDVAVRLFKEDANDGFKRRVTGGFWNTDPTYPSKPHAGTDYGADIGEELIAYDDFEVIGVNSGHSDYGKHVFLYFPKIDKTGHYAHMDSINVSVGQTGARGAVIGTSGNTGKSQGPHLHFGFAYGRVTSTVKGKEGEIWLNFETYVYEGGLIAQDGKFTVTHTDGVNVRTSPSTDGERVSGLAKGETVIYDNYIDAEGFRWVSWLNDGVRVYAARRKLDDSEVYGDAEFINAPTEPSKPNHTDSKVGKVLVVRHGSYLKGKFYAYPTLEDAKNKTNPYDPWTVNKDLEFGILEDCDPFFKCAQWGKTPMSGTDHVWIEYESGVGFDEA